MSEPTPKGKLANALTLVRDLTLGASSYYAIAELFTITLRDFLQVLLWSTVGVAVAYPLYQAARRLAAKSGE